MKSIQRICLPLTLLLSAFYEIQAPEKQNEI